MKQLAWLLLLVLAGCVGSDKHQIRALDPAHMDLSVDPCESFFDYAAGNWIANNPIPEKESSWNPFVILRQKSKDDLIALLKGLQGQDFEPGSEKMKLRDFFHSGLVDRSGPSALKGYLYSQGIVEQKGLWQLFGEAAVLGIPSPVSFQILPDKRKNDEYAVYLGQSGLGLPNRDYYLDQGDRYATIRAAYAQHIDRMFERFGIDASGAAVIAIETDVAQHAWSNADNRDPVATYTKRNLSDLKEDRPKLRLKSLLRGAGLPQAERVILKQSTYFHALARILDLHSSADWVAYLNWQLIRSYAPVLDPGTEALHFDFYGRTLRGQKEMAPIEERVAMVVNEHMGQPLGKLYVEQHFNEESKQAVLSMMDRIRAVYRQRIQKLEWMGEPTKGRALQKLDSMGYKIGYPDVWQDYSRLEIQADNYLINTIKGRIFTHHLMLERWGKKVDRNEWRTTPQMVNAFYSTDRNEIIFPAAILQPPFYHISFDPAVNYGGIGTVIGHEFTHGFDDKGSQFDWSGNLVDWWQPEDRERFVALGDRLVSQYEQYYPLAGLHLDGRNTLGENIADLGGVTLAFHALSQLNSNKRIDGFDQNERFFIAYANIWKSLSTEEEMVRRIKSDSHAPGRYRVNGPLSNFTPFYQTFGNCRKGAMFRPDSARIRIW